MSQKKPSLSLDSSLVQDDVPLEVMRKVYLGSIYSAFNLDGLVKCGITHILNASRIQITFPNQFTYLSIDIRDKEDSNILACIPTSNIFIEAGIDRGAILVHCFGGKSRSPAFIAAFLMSSYNWTFEDACKQIKSVRPAMEINLGFECQLRAYYAANFDVYIAQQLLLRTRIRELHLVRNGKESFRLDSKNDAKDAKPYQRNIFQESINFSRQISGGLKRTLSDAKGYGDPSQSRSDTTITDNMDVDLDNDDSLSLSTPNGKLFNGSVYLRDRDALEESVDSGITTSSAMSLEHIAGDAITRSDCTKRSPFVSSNNRMKLALDEDNSKPDFHIANESSRFRVSALGISNEVDQTLRPSSGDNHSKKIKAAGRSASKRSSLTFSSARDVMAKFPSCRLSQPGCQWIRIMPPLRGLEKDFKCSWCDTKLFQLANVLRVDLNLSDMMHKFQVDLKQSNFYERNQCGNISLSPENESCYSSSFANIGASPRVENVRKPSGLLPPISNNTSVGASVKSHKVFQMSGGFDMDIDESDNIVTSYKDDDIWSAQKSSLKTTRAAASKNKSFNFDIFNGGETSTPPTDFPTQKQLLRQEALFSTTPRESSNLFMSSPRMLPNVADGANICAASPRTTRLSKSHKVIIDDRTSENNSSYRLGPPYHNAPLGYDESPRVNLPPVRAVDSSATMNGMWCRPKSAEQRRWLARMNLLKEGDKRVLSIAEADILASQHAYKNDKYLYIEYLEWMGREIFSLEKDHGDISCPVCKNVVGKWMWTPSKRLLQDGILEAPLFCIPKQVLYHTDVSLDPTPSGTPREEREHSFC